MIMLGIILLVVSLVKLFILIPSLEQFDSSFIESSLVDPSKVKNILQLIIGFDGILELIASLFIIFIV